MTLTHKQTERRPLYYNVRNRQHLFLGQPFVSGRVIYSLLRNFGLVSVWVFGGIVKDRIAPKKLPTGIGMAELSDDEMCNVKTPNRGWHVRAVRRCVI